MNEIFENNFTLPGFLIENLKAYVHKIYLATTKIAGTPPKHISFNKSSPLREKFKRSFSSETAQIKISQVTRRPVYDMNRIFNNSLSFPYSRIENHEASLHRISRHTFPTTDMLHSTKESTYTG